VPGDPIVGIDLGTTNSVVAAWDDATDRAKVLVDERGTGIHPSVVSFHPNGSVIVGAEAKQRRIIDPKNTVYSAKRLIGRTFRSREVQTAASRMPYPIREGANQQPVIATRAGEFAIPEISAIVLDHMRKVANKALSAEINRAVVTVPANFNDAQRSATATAGAIAGLTVVRVLNEPTAAALAYGHNRKLNQTIAVYDFGGGTFDITLLRLQDTVYQVLATAGDSFLGGDDIDERLVDHMVQMFLQKERIDLRSNEVTMMRLRTVAEQVKIELSRRSRAMVKIDEIAFGAGGQPLDFEVEISRDELIAKCADLIEATFPVCEEAVRIAGLKPGQIDDIILVGGVTKMPYVRERVAQFFEKQARTDVNPDEAVALGAALQAVSLERILSAPARAQTNRPTDRAAVVPVPSQPTQTGTGETTAAATTAEVGEPTSEITLQQAELEEITGVRQPPSGLLRPTKPGSTARGIRVATERPVQRGEFVDDISKPGTSPGAEPLARITKRDGAVPPPPTQKTLMGASPPPIPPPRAAPPIPGSIDLAALQAAAEAAERSTMTLDLDLPPPTPGAVPAANLPTVLGMTPVTPSAASLPTQMEMRPPVAAPPPVAPPPVASVIDVIPHTLGIGTIAGYCEELVRRNSRVPAQTHKLFSTSRDSQQVVRIRVCSGESRRIDENVVLGDLVLEGLQPRPRGEARIEVTFHIDASGILHVRARDSVTGIEQRASLDIAGAQSPQEIEAAKQRLRGMNRV
jgi:molecular chaperone DnaK